MKPSFLAVVGIIILTVKCVTADPKETIILNAVSNFLKTVRARLAHVSALGLDAGIVSTAGIATRFKESIKAIFPGTLWCGDGTIAKKSDELGYFKLADACCREHDNCSDIILGGQSKYGLRNPGLFTRSNCACDDKFRKCLKATDSIISNNIGFTYFTILGPQCIKLEYPKVKCEKRLWFRCATYTLNFTGNPLYQWFDNQYY